MTIRKALFFDNGWFFVLDSEGVSFKSEEGDHFYLANEEFSAIVELYFDHKHPEEEEEEPEHTPSSAPPSKQPGRNSTWTKTEEEVLIEAVTQALSKGSWGRGGRAAFIRNLADHVIDRSFEAIAARYAKLRRQGVFDKAIRQGKYHVEGSNSLVLSEKELSL